MGSVNSFIISTLTTNPLLFWIIIVILSLSCGLIGFLINCLLNHNFKMESLIMFLAVALFIISLISSVMTDNQSIMIILLNFFSTIIFSWLLTKKNSKEEFNSMQAELAKKSYRYINTIESSTCSAYKMIEQHTKDASPEELIGKLSVAISSIRTTITACKMDWFDMLSEKDKQIYKENPCSNTPTPTISNMNVASPANSPSSQECAPHDVINQEDA